MKSNRCGGESSKDEFAREKHRKTKMEKATETEKYKGRETKRGRGMREESTGIEKGTDGEGERGKETYVSLSLPLPVLSPRQTLVR